MKVVVNETGFYAGTHHKAGAEVEMHEKVAKPFLPPYGTQLSVAEAVEPAAKAGVAFQVEVRPGGGGGRVSTSGNKAD